jgi:hypothetical protein
MEASVEDGPASAFGNRAQHSEGSIHGKEDDAKATYKSWK